jgi:AcrR family transcriptional regulator
MTKPKPIDRRIQRTRALLQDALIDLMTEKGYEKLTVQDIIDRANVGRATFYAHFADKETLLGSRLEDLRAMLAQAQRVALARPGGWKERGLGYSLPMLAHALSHEALYLAIVGKESGALVLHRIQRTLVDLAATDLAALDRKRPAAQRQLAAEYIGGAFMSVLTWWIGGGARAQPSEVDGILRQLVMHGLPDDLGGRS